MRRSHLIQNYRNKTGEHCGSTAMRNLLHHYCGLELTEGEVFGLGSGIDFVLLEGTLYEPNVMLFGRGMSMETDITDALGIDYREETEPDNAKAWELTRQQVLEGHPTMLSGDALYLDYRDFKVHFPSHRYVLLGFDDDTRTAYVADRIDAETQACSYDALEKSRNPPDFMSTYNLWGRFHGTDVTRSIDDAMRLALGRTAQRMLGVGSGDGAMTSDAGEHGYTMSSGIQGLNTAANRFKGWSEREDFPQIARYAAACIESFGTGGGNFRLLYADFLDSAHRHLPTIVDADAAETIRASAAAWTKLSHQLADAGLAPLLERQPLIGAAADTLRSIAELEEGVFERLAATTTRDTSSATA